MTRAHVAVLDIGKTNAKLALVDAADHSEIDVVTRPNLVLPGPPYPHFDVEGHWEFLLDAISRFHAQHGIDAICPTTHGASGALIGADGMLAAPILDYEHAGPDEVSAGYDALRPGFEETGSPRLSGGLNLGAQIHWQFSRDPDLRVRTRSIVTYPQYWSHRLTGVLASDVSSLGSHTDLWNPSKRRFSSLVDRLDIAEKVAPARKSADVLGGLLPDIAARTGLRTGTPVHCGIHDSNASLLPHLMSKEPPYSVVSTGTWVIVMTIGGAEVVLDPARDTLVNVNALGAPVPSAKFMGGREYELILDGHYGDCDKATAARVAAEGPMLMPAVVPDSGPFQGRTARWIGREPARGSAERAAAVGFYLAMMTSESLSLAGHRGTIIVEGPFGGNACYLSMLSAAVGSPVEVARGSTGTSRGAAMLASAAGTPPDESDYWHAVPWRTSALAIYANRWRAAASGLPAQ